MPPAAPTSRASARLSLVPIGLAAAALVAYHGTFDAPFVLDDVPAIVENPTIRSLWPPPLRPPAGGGLTVEARPVLNLSFAFNYAWTGVGVWSYHLVNLAIHVANAWLLFELVRRTAATAAVRGALGASEGFALAVALLFTVHPLQTESVTYVVQRAESLCAFFYLLTLYAFLRGGDGSAAWPAVSVGACLLGMGSKEVMASAPLIVLLYDGTFRAGTVRQALALRPRYYLALASTWVLLAALVVGFGGRGGSVGFAAGVPWPAYLLTQAQATVSYLKLALWPHPLVFDYGTRLAASLSDVLPQVLASGTLVAGTAVALVRRPPLGFLGAWFLALLAPTALVPVATQTAAEHRMYLALAAVLVLAGAGLRRAFGPRTAALLAASAIVAGTLLTVRRNAVYESNLALWADTAAKRPENTRARNNLALALAAAGRREEAVGHLQAALRIEPGAVEFHNNLATVYADLGRFPEALAEIEAVLATVPDLAEAHDTRGHVAERMGRTDEAMRWYESAVRRKPTLAESHRNLGRLLVAAGRAEEGRRHLAEALRLRPDDPEAAAALSAR